MFSVLGCGSVFKVDTIAQFNVLYSFQGPEAGPDGAYPQGRLTQDLAGNLPLGNQRILEVARALAADPVLIVLDEPAAGLRKPEKEALAALLRALRADGISILLVEHDMDFVMGLVDRIVVMDFGSKLMEGNPAEVRASAIVQEAYLGGVA